MVVRVDGRRDGEGMEKMEDGIVRDTVGGMTRYDKGMTANMRWQQHAFCSIKRSGQSGPEEGP